MRVNPSEGVTRRVPQRQRCIPKKPSCFLGGIFEYRNRRSCKPYTSGNEVNINSGLIYDCCASPRIEPDNIVLYSENLLYFVPGASHGYHA